MDSINSVNTQPPEPPSTNPPSKARATSKMADKKKNRLPVYDENECKDYGEENDKKESEDIEGTCRTILVTGLSKKISKDAIELYFENKKKTGGGEIVSATINLKKLEAVVEFKESEGTLYIIYIVKAFVIFFVTNMYIDCCYGSVKLQMIGKKSYDTADCIMLYERPFRLSVTFD